jgi:hypothetical protein
MSFPDASSRRLMASSCEAISGSVPSNKYGWFAHFRSCTTRERRDTT